MPVTGLDVTEVLGAEGLPSSARARIDPVGLDLAIEPVDFGPLLLTSTDGRVSRFPRGHGPVHRRRRAHGDGMDRVEPARVRRRTGGSLPVVRLSLQPSLDASAYRFVHVLRTRFAETDAMGIIHHGAYPAYLEEARAAMLRDAGFPYEAVRTGPDGVDFAVLELYVRHRRPLRFDDEVARPRAGGRPDPDHLPGRLPAGRSTARPGPRR